MPKTQTVFPSLINGKWDVCCQKFDTFEEADEYAKNYEEFGDDGYYDHSADVDHVCN